MSSPVRLQHSIMPSFNRHSKNKPANSGCKSQPFSRTQNYSFYRNLPRTLFNIINKSSNCIIFLLQIRVWPGQYWSVQTKQTHIIPPLIRQHCRFNRPFRKKIAKIFTEWSPKSIPFKNRQKFLPFHPEMQFRLRIARFFNVFARQRRFATFP